MTRFLLIRHGETLWNREQRIQGQKNSELSPAGVEQAHAAAACLGAESADLLVSSDLDRTMQTAAPISVATGFALEGCTLAEIAERFPDHHARWRSRDPAYAMPGGESLLQMRVRVKATLESIATRGHRKVLVVTHGGVLDAIYRLATGTPDEAKRDWPLLNASFNHVEISGDTWLLREWGVVSHLRAAGDESG